MIDFKKLSKIYRERKSRWKIKNEKVSPEYIYEPVYYTCYGCKKEKDCPEAWDPYNIDGDCLMEK